MGLLSQLMANSWKLKETAPFKENFDIVVIGGGIVGSSASIRYNLSGYKVCIVEKSSEFLDKAGESLHPSCKVFFDKIGYHFTNATGVEYTGNIVKWGSDDISYRDFIFNPYGNGIAADRAWLERDLAKRSISLGNALYMGAKVIGKTYSNGRWELSVLQAGELIKIKCRLIICCAGRSLFKMEKKQSRSFYDRQIGLSVTLRSAPGYFRQLLIESMKEGWMYSNALPAGKLVLTYFTDNDLIIGNRLEWLQEKFKQSCLMHKMIGEWDIDKLIAENYYDSRTYWTNIQCSSGWLALGDQAYAIDPLSGEGIKKNMEMIEYVNEHLPGFISHETKTHIDYYGYNRSNFDQYIKDGQGVYATEKRWEDNTYWKRRRYSTFY